MKKHNKEDFLVCNRCGKKLDFWDIQEDLHIESVLGYGSKYDGEYIRLRLCCHCFDQLVDECKASPIRNLYEDSVSGDCNLPCYEVYDALEEE